MKDIVITALVGLGGALVGASGSMLSGLLANRSQIKRLEMENERLDRLKVSDMKRSLLEELYVEAEAMQKAFGAVFIWSALFMDDQINRESFNEKSQQEIQKRPVRVDRMEFLVAAYFDDLVPAWNAVKATRDRANELRPIAGGSRRPEHITIANKAAFSKEIDRFNTDLDHFKNAITAAVRTLDS